MSAPSNIEPKYKHNECDKAIIKGRLDLACNGCIDIFNHNPSSVAEEPLRPEPKDESIEDSDLRAIGKLFVTYRIKCDMAVSDRDDHYYTQAQYEKAIQWELDLALKQLEALLIKGQIKIADEILDEYAFGGKSELDFGKWLKARIEALHHRSEGTQT